MAAGKKEAEEVGGYKMEIKVLSKDKENKKISFILKNSNVFFANTLRRMILEEVPVLAIEDVDFKENSSALYDEIVAHRLGLIPIKTDLKSYSLPEECTCKGKGCAKCTLKLTLQSKSPGIVYAAEIKSKDPKCKPVYGKMPVAKLIKGQEIELVATAMLGKGKNHAKWTPCWVYYKAYPEIEIKKDCEDAAKACPVNVFDFKQGKLTINEDNLLKCHLCDACVDACPKGAINVKDSNTDFIFNLESWGQLEPQEIVKTAVDEFQKKLAEFEKQLK